MTNERRGWNHPVLAGLVGVFAGALSIALIEAAGKRLLGSAGDPRDPATLSGADYATVLVAWIVGAGVAGLVGTAWTRGRTRIPGLVAALVLFCASVATLFAIPHPAWMVAGALLAMPAAAWAGTRARPLARR